MEKIRVGIVGTGYTVGIAGNHAKGYLQNPGCVLTAVCDIVPGRAAQWAKEKIWRWKSVLTTMSCLRR